MNGTVHCGCRDARELLLAVGAGVTEGEYATARW
jgi:hypothetical protein